MRLSISNRQTGFLALIQGAIAYEWLKSGIEKATDPAFIPGMTKTVGAFASNNPNVGFKTFLSGTVQPNAEGFGYLVMYSEILTGIGLALGALFLLFKTTRQLQSGALLLTGFAALSGAVMSFSFWQAAGWMSPSTDGINVVMGLIEVVIGAAAITALAAMRRTQPQPELNPMSITGTVTQRRPAALLHR